MKNSLSSRLLVYLVISMLIILFSMGVVLVISLKLQEVADRRFKDEQYFQQLQNQLTELQSPLNTYLTSYSSSALSKLLFISETLHESIPENRPITSRNSDLIKREIYFLIDAYLDRLSEVIEQKRGRKVQEYVRNYDDLLTMYSYINREINTVSLLGFRVQLEVYRNFLDFFRKLQLYGLLQIILATALAFSLLMRLVDTFAGPMAQLSSLAGKLSAGNFSIPDVHLSSVNEVNQVAEAFNQMKHNIHRYIEELREKKEFERQVMEEKVRNLRMEQVLKRMELYTMQAQMNPHFLFNTLNTGVQLAIVEDADKTAEFMEKLAALFRYNIKDKQFFVPLQHELMGLEIYFSILKIRFPKTLRLVLDIEEEIADQYDCPAMVLQPLVENSVLHAFKRKEGKGTVHVSVSYEEPVLLMSVRDDGQGIPPETVKTLLTPHTHDYSISSHVMGLENVIQRCYFFYPDQKDVIVINSELGRGTEIVIRINTEVEPCIKL